MGSSSLDHAASQGNSNARIRVILDTGIFYD